MGAFVKGLDLVEAFFYQAAAPIIARNFPDLHFSAGLIGYGSDVLGYDTEISSDHMWGPRFHLFLPEEDYAALAPELSEVLSQELPPQFQGFSTSFTPPDKEGTRVPAAVSQGPVQHLIEFHTVRGYFKEYLGYDPDAALAPADWLTFDEHALLGVTSGRLFRDGLGLESIRQRLAYYPEDVWMYMLASQWMMISDEEPFVGRCGHAGDEIGSRLVAARLVQYLMRLGFLFEKKYAPYSKWFGTAFRQLHIAEQLLPPLEEALAAANWSDRQDALGRAYEIVARRHNALGLTRFVEPAVRFFYTRPYKVIAADRFADALLEVLNSGEGFKSDALIGSVCQFSPVTKLNSYPDLCKRLRVLYG
jgi:hypothetical protein